MLEHRDRFVTKEELLDEIWGDRFVSESALTSRIKSARRAVGDDGRNQAVIRTIHGRGYQFVAEIVGVAESTGVAEMRGDQPPSAQVPSVSSPGETVGRDDLIVEIVGALDGGDLFSLVGPAGVGKTHVARRVAADHDGAAWFVPLAQVRDPSGVADAVLDALGTPRLADRSATDSVVAVAREREGLLVVDNCEHVLDTVRSLVRRLADADASITVLATSRQRIGAPGEHVVSVPVLEPESATKLFVDRIARHGGRADLDDPVIATICRRLDHLPLAVELASARARVLGPAAVARLLDDRWSLLQSAGEVEPHHETLHRAIAASVESLDDGPRRALAAFSVFAGPFDLESAMAVSRTGGDAPPIDAVADLVELCERSLVLIDDRGDDEPRYHVLESVRLFASEQFGGADEARTAHLVHFRQRAEARRVRLDGPALETAMVEADADWPEVRAAVTHAFAADHLDEAAVLLAAVAEYAELTQRLEFGDWAERLLALTDGDRGDHDDELDRVRAGLARLVVLEDLDHAIAVGEDAGDSAADADVAIAAAWCSFMVGDHDVGRRHLATADGVRRGTRGLGELYVLGLASFHLTRAGDDPTEAVARIRRLTRRGGPVGRSFLAWGEAALALSHGDHDAALDSIEDLLVDARESGLELLVLVGLRMRTVALAGHDDLVMVARCLLDGLEHYRERGRWTSALSDAPMAARVLTSVGRDEIALRILASHRPSGSVGGWSTTLADRLTTTILDRAPSLTSVNEMTPWPPERLTDEIILELVDLLESGDLD
ncbi:MAG: winged helix-turn-helix domain-containing protein [Actinomycetota bacterium]